MKGKKKSFYLRWALLFILDCRTDYIHRLVMASITNLFILPNKKKKNNTCFLYFSSPQEIAIGHNWPKRDEKDGQWMWWWRRSIKINGQIMLRSLCNSGDKHVRLFKMITHNMVSEGKRATAATVLELVSITHLVHVSNTYCRHRKQWVVSH